MGRHPRAASRRPCRALLRRCPSGGAGPYARCRDPLGRDQFYRAVRPSTTSSGAGLRPLLISDHRSAALLPVARPQAHGWRSLGTYLDLGAAGVERAVSRDGRHGKHHRADLVRATCRSHDDHADRATQWLCDRSHRRRKPRSPLLRLAHASGERGAGLGTASQLVLSRHPRHGGGFESGDRGAARQGARAVLLCRLLGRRAAGSRRRAAIS